MDGGRGRRGSVVFVEERTKIEKEEKGNVLKRKKEKKKGTEIKKRRMLE